MAFVHVHAVHLLADDRVRLLQQKLAKLQAADAVSDNVCRMPKLTLATDANRFAFHRMKPLACEGDVLFYSDVNNVIHLNRTVLGARQLAKCEYTGIEWENDDTYRMLEPVVVEKEPFEYRMKTDFYRVQCYLNTTKTQQRKLLSLENVPKSSSRNVRSLLEDKFENEADVNDVIQQPRMIGSMGMPDLPDVMLQRQIQENYDENVNLKEKVDIPDDIDDGDDDVLETDDGYDDYEPLDDDYRLQDQLYDDYANWPGRTSGDFDQYFTQIAVDDDVLERVRTTRAKRHSLQINVLMFALDSMSHMSYQRLLPRTYAYLRDELNAVILNGYNIVGDATTAAMLPILTGTYCMCW